MSLYNIMHGVTPATFFLMPMLGEKHPEEYPRFRDCFTKDHEHPEWDNHIHVYTRVGGGNRGSGYGEEELYKHPNFVATFDDDYDSTFATYVFSIPDEWKEDFDKIESGKIRDISAAYKERIYKVFPKLKDQFDKIFTEITT